MAYNDSEALQPDNSYSLGGYTFDLNVSYIHEPDEDLVAISAICNGPDGRRESTPIYLSSGTTVESWSVEANETEASVYANYSLDIIQLNEPVNLFPIVQGTVFDGDPEGSVNYYVSDLESSSQVYMLKKPFTTHDMNGCMVSLEPFSGKTKRKAPPGWSAHEVAFSSTPINYRGKTAYVGYRYTGTTAWSQVQMSASQSVSVELTGAIALLYSEEDESGERLIGRFEIDIREADPENWDEPGDTGDPSYTLNLTVTGASAGTHNSENVPLDGETQSVYGSGGNGGNGGGGGAGASTVIVYDFTTDKAGSVNQTATARGPGAGGPGGSGGRGADGCIIIFY